MPLSMNIGIDGASAIPDMRTAAAEEVDGSRSRAGETVGALGVGSRRCKWAAEAWREASHVSNQRRKKASTMRDSPFIRRGIGSCDPEHHR